MPETTIETLREYSETDAKQLGRLMTFLSERFSGEPVPRELLEMIINSSFHDQLVARIDGRIVGAATLSLTMGVAAGRHGYLEDFVTDPSVRGQGTGSRIWQEIIKWCQDQGVDLSFTSRASRPEAHAFYTAKGAHIRDTTVFRVNVPDR